MLFRSVEMEGEEDDFPVDDDDDEKAYPDVAADPDRKKGTEFVVDPNFEPEYETDEDLPNLLKTFACNIFIMGLLIFTYVLHLTVDFLNKWPALVYARDLHA